LRVIISSQYCSYKDFTHVRTRPWHRRCLCSFPGRRSQAQNHKSRCYYNNPTCSPGLASRCPSLALQRYARAGAKRRAAQKECQAKTSRHALSWLNTHT
jgi:hypothetical protein